MTRREAHLDAMLRHLGATYYQTLHGEATPQDVEKALRTVEQEAAREKAPPTPRGRGHRAGRWRVRDVMTSEVLAVDKRTPGPQIARLMSEHHINAVPVLTGSHKVAGVVSEADLLRTQHRPGERTGILRRRPAAGKAPAYTAAQLMSSPAITIHPDAPIGAAARRMTESNLTLLPVVDTAGQLIGVISRRDLLKVFLRPDEDIVAEVRRMLSEVLLIDPGTVTVSASQGLVTLKGSLARDDLPAVAVRLTTDIDGVLGVVDKLTTPSMAATRPSG